MATAMLWAMRSVCQRLHVGAVITDATMRRVMSVGYNGPARGLPHDRCKKEAEGGCGCLHAEDNAIARVDGTVGGQVLFVTVAPCEQCAQRIVQAGITDVFWLNEYRNEAGICLLQQCGVNVERVLRTTMVSLFSEASTSRWT